MRYADLIQLPIKKASHMARVLSILSIALGALLVSAPVQADEPAPNWEIGEICASSSLGVQCPRIESRNRSSLLLRWEALPVEDRRACKTEVTEHGAPSYKQLLNCLEARQLKTLEDGAQPAAIGANSTAGHS